MQHVKKYGIKVLIVVFLLSGCKKYIQVEPPVTSINDAIVFQDDATAAAALTGIYTSISYSTSVSGNAGISMLTGLASDELTLYSGVTNPTHIAYYTNQLIATPNSNIGSETWAPLYQFIFAANSAIKGISISEKLTPSIKSQLLGEAFFIRAFCYFYLVNLYGEVPLVLGTDPNINAKLPRSPVTDIYGQIIDDLEEAKLNLSSDFLDGSVTQVVINRLRPTKWAASALLARVNLFTKNYQQAAIQSSEVINNSSLFNLTSPAETFHMNNTEAIWQLQPVRWGRNTDEGLAYVLPSSGPSNADGEVGNPAYLSQTLVDQFEPQDERYINWIGRVSVNGITYYFPYKYKSAIVGDPVTEFLTVMRLGEQYLIRSEALAHSGKITEALADLNTVRNRAGLPAVTTEDQEELQRLILNERRRELFTEWGHRWIDLKRVGEINSVMQLLTPSKNSSWQDSDALFPLPYTDIQRNSNATQNPGYN